MSVSSGPSGLSGPSGPSGQAEIERGLKKLQPAILDEFLIAREKISSACNDEELVIWAKEGLTIANQTVRSWEAAVEYFRAGPEVAKFLPFPSFMQWARCGTYLSQDSPTLAQAYFKASPAVVYSLRAQYIPRWAGLGRSLYKGTWKSSNLASKFFEASPQLVRDLPFWDIELFSGLMDALSSKSYDMAVDCLLLGKTVLPQMGREREALLSLLRTLSEGSWRDVKSCLEVSVSVLALVEESQRGRFIRIAERMAKAGQRETGGFLLEGSQSISRVNSSFHRHILDLCETLLSISPQAMPPFLKGLGAVLNRITLTQLDVWFEQGVSLLKENPDGGLAYFKVESNTSEQVLETLSSSLELDRVRGVMRLYCQAISGFPVEIMTSKDLVHKGIGWVSESHAATEGTKVFLPPVVDRYPRKDENFGWFKVVSTHQVAHLEFGSFSFSFERPATLFKDWRPRLEADAPGRQEAEPQQSLAADASPQSAETGYLTDMGHFFHFFDDRRLALDIFTVLEDARLDYRVKAEYPGIGRIYGDVQKVALADRPPMEELPNRQSMVELLVHLSLEQFKGLPVAPGNRDIARVLAKILKRLRNAGATVEDTAEATVRAYEIISRLPNEQEPARGFSDGRFRRPGGILRRGVGRVASEASTRGAANG